MYAHAVVVGAPLSSTSIRLSPSVLSFTQSHHGYTETGGRSHGLFRGFNVSYREHPTGAEQQTFMTKRLMDFKSLKVQTVYMFMVQPYTLEGPGPEFGPITVKTGEGGTRH